jgi:anti-anti-sigma factor
MEFIREKKEDWNVYKIRGEMSFANIDKLDTLEDDVKTTIKKGEFKFIFDFDKVTFIDSSGVSIIIICISPAIKNSEKIKLCGLSGEADKAFKLINIDFAVNYYPTLEKALESL